MIISNIGLIQSYEICYTLIVQYAQVTADSFYDTYRFIVLWWFAFTLCHAFSYTKEYIVIL